MRFIALSVTLLACSAVACAQSRKAVFIITDAEGVAGICRQSQTEPTNSEHQRLITGEVNAAIRGFIQGGASEVVVWDGHDGSQTLSVLTIEPDAKLIHGSLGASMLLERGWAAVAFLGQHARANRSPAVMAHSYSSLGIQKMIMNGKEVGEIETRAALAGWFGVPVIFLSGDQAAAEDLKAIVPEAEVAVVKEAFGYYACMSVSAPAAQKLIQQKARESMARIGQIKPYKIEGPVTLEIEVSTRSTLSPQTSYQPGVERAGPRTLRYSGKDFMEAWTRYAGR
ncbi:MAG: M55 family metallopeptidase [Acidobacteria bacterium]|nr:M55 family metallopeptidase [Acidobacteriota bacterium]